jgi:hypothetical protein
LKKRKNLKNFEPTLRRIDDYNGTETKEKKRIIRNVIIGLLVAGGIYSFFFNQFGAVEDEIPNAPHLLKPKGF